MKNADILYCGEYTGFAGGIERYAHQTALRLREAGCRVDWCGCRSERGEALFRSGFDSVFSAAELRNGTTGYDLVGLHKLPSAPFLNLLRERFGKRVVFLAHDHDLYCPRRHYYTPFGRINCRRAYAPVRCGICSRITSPRNWGNAGQDRSALLKEFRSLHTAVLSHFMKENLMRNGFREERIHLLPPVIEALPSPPGNGDDGTLKLLFLGQLIRGKGADLMLEALARLEIPWRATVAGDGNDRAMLEALARRLGIADRVSFPGWTDDPESRFACSDAAVFPSRWQEPFGLSGAEALAHGLPVAAFDTGGVREWLEDGVSGFIVPERDVAALAERLERFYREPALRKRMGEAGMEKVRRCFSPERFREAIEHLLEVTAS